MKETRSARSDSEFRGQSRISRVDIAVRATFSSYAVFYSLTPYRDAVLTAVFTVYGFEDPVYLVDALDPVGPVATYLDVHRTFIEG